MNWWRFAAATVCFGMEVMLAATSTIPCTVWLRIQIWFGLLFLVITFVAAPAYALITAEWPDDLKDKDWYCRVGAFCVLAGVTVITGGFFAVWLEWREEREW